MAVALGVKDGGKLRRNVLIPLLQGTPEDEASAKLAPTDWEECRPRPSVLSLPKSPDGRGTSGLGVFVRLSDDEHRHLYCLCGEGETVTYHARLAIAEYCQNHPIPRQ